LTLLSQPPETREHSAVFVDAPGGSGKTYTFKAILAKVRSNGEIAIAVAAFTKLSNVWIYKKE
jgi:superfamily II DNA or RNA helicase